MKGDLFYGSVRLRSCAAGKVHLETLCSTTMSSSSLGLITWKEVSPFYVNVDTSGRLAQADTLKPFTFFILEFGWG